MKAIALIRVSTQIQDLQSQKEKVFTAMKNDGFKATEIISIENKESAVKLSEEERLGLIEMKECIENQDVSAVYCYELSRLSRRSADLYKLRDYLLQHKVQLVVLNPYFKCFDEKDWTPSTTSNIMFSIFTAMAENEGYLRRERTMRGIAKARREGRWTGGQRLFGYDTDENNRYVVNEHEADIIRQIYDLYVNQDKGSYQVAKIIQSEYGGFRKNNCFESCLSRVRSILANELYVGKTIYTPQIITEKMFNRCLQKREKNKFGPKKKTKHVSFCQGILFSRMDGTLFHACVKQHCYTNRNQKRNVHVSYNHIDSLVWHLASMERAGKMSFRVSGLYDKLKKELVFYERQLLTLQEEAKEIQKKFERVEYRFIEGKISESAANKIQRKLDKELSSNKTETKMVQDSIRSVKSLLKKAATNIPGDWETVLKSLDKLDDKSKSEIVHEEIKAVFVSKPADKKKKFYCTIDVELTDGVTRTFVLNTFNKKIWEKHGDQSLHEYPVTIYDRSDYKTAQRKMNFKNGIKRENMKYPN